jgi:predicted PurR-regulated permease PerM
MTAPADGEQNRGFPGGSWPPPSYWARVTGVVIGMVVAARILATLQDILLIVVGALVVALGLQPAIRTMERRGLRRGTAMAVIVLAGLLLVAAVAAAIIPPILSQSAEALEAIPDLLGEFGIRSPWLGDLLNGIDPSEGNGNALVGALGLAGGLAKGAFHLITLLLLTPYFAMAMPAMKSGVLRLLRREHRRDFVDIINQSTDLTSNYIIGNLTISLIAGVVTFAGLSLIGVPYALALSAWVAVTDLIPAFGALLGALPVLTVAALTGGAELVWSMALLVGYQQFENYLVAPRVMKRAVDLSPPVVIVALMVGGALAGLIGALLALPIAALAKVLVVEFLVKERIDQVRTDGIAGAEISRPRRFSPGTGSRPIP